MERTEAFWIFLITTCCAVQGVCGQSVEVDSEGLTGYAGSKVDMRCLFIQSVPPVKISQVTWQKLVNGIKQNVAIANPSLGVSVAPAYKDRVRFKNQGVRRRVPALEDTSITLGNLRLEDDATYSCEYTTFPAGNRENYVNLTIFTRPSSEVKLSTPTLVARSTTLKMPVATCLSVNGKPAPSIRWEASVPGETTAQEVRNPDGTVTVSSDFILIPTRDMDQKSLTCITSYNEEVYSDSVTLDIQYEPEVYVDGFDGNWYLNRENVQLTCYADANPPVSLFQWKMVNGTLPASVEIRDNILIFKEPITYELGGTYVCDATNSIGSQSGSVEVNIAEKPRPLIAPGDMASVVGLVLCGGATLGVAIGVVTFKMRKDCAERDDDGNINELRKLRINSTHSKRSSKSSMSTKMASSSAKRRSGDEKQHATQLQPETANNTNSNTNETDYRVSYRLACEKGDGPYSPPISPPHLSLLPQQPYPTTTSASAQLSANSSPRTHTSPSSNHTFSPPTASQPTHTTAAIFRFPDIPESSTPPGVKPYTFPKEQYV